MATYTYNGISGNDYLNYTGSDVLEANGNDGDDYLWGNSQNDLLYGGNGQDTLRGWYGDDFLVGDDLFSTSTGNDSLYGEYGNDTLYGGSGNDILSGGDGNDFLSGSGSSRSSELDTLTGGTGSDFFSLGYNGSYTEIDYLGSGYAIITDFSPVEGDRIRLGGSASNYTFDTQQNLYGSSAADTAIYYNNNLIGVVADNTGLNTNLSTSTDFSLVGGHGF